MFVNVRKNSLCNTGNSRTQAGNPKINIMGASRYGDFKFLLPEFSQMIFSPGPLIYKLRQGLKNFKVGDYLITYR